MFDELYEELEKGRDPYKLLAGHVLGKQPDDVTRDERHRFKEAFYVLFHFKGPDLIRGFMEDLRQLDKLPAVKEYFRSKM